MKCAIFEKNICEYEEMSCANYFDNIADCGNGQRMAAKAMACVEKL